MPEANEAKMPEGIITEAMIKEMRQKIGLNLRVEHSINNEEEEAFPDRRKFLLL